MLTFVVVYDKIALNPETKIQNFFTRLLTGYMHDVHTITVDNGTEFADHQTIAKKLKTKVFFAHPYSAWEKGLIENTNKLIRQYIPKKTDFRTLNN